MSYDNLQGYIATTGSKNIATASGTNTYTATLSPPITAYAPTQAFFIKFTNANTGASTINLDGLGAKDIRKNGVALVSGDILAGGIYLIGYDGTNFQLLGNDNQKATTAQINTGTQVNRDVQVVELEASKYLNQSNSKLSATAAGTNTYTATIAPAITAYVNTQRFYIKFTNANTGASSINLNGLGAKDIRKNGVALVSGDILAGGIYLIGYDGTNFQLLGNDNQKATTAQINTGTQVNRDVQVVELEASKYITQAGSKIFAIASGTDTYTATISPAITAYAAGQVFNIQFTNANTGASTINLNGLGAQSIVKNNNNPLGAADIEAGHIQAIAYDGTDFQIIGEIAPASALNSPQTVVAGGSTTTTASVFDFAGGTTIMSGMSVSIDRGNYLLFFGTSVEHDTANQSIFTAISVDGVFEAGTEREWANASTNIKGYATYAAIPVSTNSTVDVAVHWIEVTGGTATSPLGRNLTLVRVG